jgi:hypothetical protein
LDKKETEKLSFSQLRDLLLDINPLDLNLVKRINAAEAQFWQASSGIAYMYMYRVSIQYLFIHCYEYWSTSNIDTHAPLDLANVSGFFAYYELNTIQPIVLAIVIVLMDIYLSVEHACMCASYRFP